MASCNSNFTILRHPVRERSRQERILFFKKDNVRKVAWKCICRAVHKPISLYKHAHAELWGEICFHKLKTKRINFGWAVSKSVCRYAVPYFIYLFLIFCYRAIFLRQYFYFNHTWSVYWYTRASLRLLISNFLHVLTFICLWNLKQMVVWLYLFILQSGC